MSGARRRRGRVTLIRPRHRTFRAPLEVVAEGAAGRARGGTGSPMSCGRGPSRPDATCRRAPRRPPRPGPAFPASQRSLRSRREAARSSAAHRAPDRREHRPPPIIGPPFGHRAPRGRSCLGTPAPPGSPRRCRRKARARGCARRRAPRSPRPARLARATWPERVSRCLAHRPPRRKQRPARENQRWTSIVTR
jgi:hypothetical protein